MHVHGPALQLIVWLAMCRYLMSVYLVATEKTLPTKWWPVLMACSNTDAAREQPVVMGMERHVNGDIESHRIPLPGMHKHSPLACLAALRKPNCDSFEHLHD